MAISLFLSKVCKLECRGGGGGGGGGVGGGGGGIHMSLVMINIGAIIIFYSFSCQLG